MQTDWKRKSSYTPPSCIQAPTPLRMSGPTPAMHNFASAPPTQDFTQKTCLRQIPRNANPLNAMPVPERRPIPGPPSDQAEADRKNKRCSGLAWQGIEVRFGRTWGVCQANAGPPESLGCRACRSFDHLSAVAPAKVEGRCPGGALCRQKGHREDALLPVAHKRTRTRAFPSQGARP